MKSKIWVLATILIVASLVLASCAPKEAAAPTAPAAPKEPVKITIFVGFGTGTSPEQQAVHKEMQDLYNSTHTDIQIEFLTVPWAERITKYSTMLAADQPPDIALPIGVGGISEFYKGWKDLSPYIQADNYDMSRFAGKTGEIHNYPGQGTLGLPLCIYPTAIYYNVDIFDAAGVDYPPAKFGEAYADGDKWTYDKMVEVAKKITLDANGNDASSPAFDATNIKQFGWNGWDWSNNIEFAMKFGDENGSGVSKDGKTSLLNTKQYMDAMNFGKDTIWTWHIRASGEQSGAFYQNAGDPMGSGMVGMWEIHTWMGWAYDSWSEKFAWNLGAIPEGPNGKIVNMVDADTAVIPAASKHPKEAWEVMKWLFEPTQYNKLIANYVCLPADKQSMASWVDEQKAKYPGVNFEVFVDALDYLEPYNHESWKPQYSRVNDAMGNAWGQVSSGENLDIEAVMKAAHEEVQKLLDDYWAANP